jgi:16S rRNA (adenine1518-N6/adenine1519-N6)-dimethyltransferase
MTVSDSSPRQTLSYLQQLFQARGIRPKNKLGQSFLIDLNLIDVIMRAAQLTRADLALEVGTGTGSLTSRLADQAGAVLSVEIDKNFHALASELLGERRNVVLLNTDMLATKNRLNPLVLDELRQLQKRFSCARLKLVANLPYAVAAPVISNFLISDLAFERMVVMVQSEIAERLLASPGTKDYGALTVLVQSLAAVEPIRRRLPPAVFWPRPQVDSAIIAILPDPGRRARVGDPLRFREFLRDLYAHRRKNLRGALAGLPSDGLTKTEVDRRLANLELDGKNRAENLSVEQHLAMFQEFSEKAR